MKTPALSVLHRRHRRLLWEGTLWAMVAGLALDLALVLIGVESRYRVGVLALAIVLAATLRLTRRRTLRETACALDARISSQNRLEALTEIRHRTDPLAAALRAEAAHYLAGRSLPRPYGWMAGVALLAGLLVFRLAAPPLPLHLAAASATATPAATRTEPARIETAVPASPPEATLRWLSPEARITATSDEIIPLSAEGVSTTGLNRLVLHVAVNGEAQPPVSLSDIFSAGTKIVATSLRLGSLRIRPDDLIAYYLTAERVPPREPSAGPTWPEIYSPLQFIEIRDALGNSTVGAFDLGKSSHELDHLRALVKGLKAVVQQAVEKSFAVAHAPLFGASSNSHGTLERLAAEEKMISQQVQDLASLAAAANLPSAARGALLQVQGEIDKAAAALARSDPAAAEAAEEKALAGLPAFEKFLDQIALKDQPEGAAGVSPTAPPPAGETSSRQLAKLARDQQALAQRLARGEAGPDVFAAEDKIARELAQLGATGGLPADIAAQIQVAAAEAEAAARQLNEGDPMAASEPAARAAMTLNQAAAGLSAGESSQVAAILARVQRLLIRAADSVGSPRNSGRGALIASQQTAQAREMLVKTANAQWAQAAAQEAKEGQAVNEGADQPQAINLKQQLAQAQADSKAASISDLIDAIDESKIQTDLQKLIEAGANADPKDKAAAAKKLLDLAQKVALRLSMFGDQSQIQAETLENLRRDSANAQRAAGASPAARQDFYENVVAHEQLAKSIVSRSAAAPDPNAGKKPDSTPGPAPDSAQSAGTQSGGQAPDDAGGPGGSGSGGSGNGDAGTGSSGSDGIPGGKSPGSGPGEGQSGDQTRGDASNSSHSAGGAMPSPSGSGSGAPGSGVSGSDGAGNGGSGLAGVSDTASLGLSGEGNLDQTGSGGSHRGPSMGSLDASGGTQGSPDPSSVGSSLPASPSSSKKPTAIGPGIGPFPKQGNLQALSPPVDEPGAKSEPRADAKSGGPVQQAGPSSRSVQNTEFASNKTIDVAKPFFGADGATPAPGVMQSEIGKAFPSAAVLGRQLNGLIAQLELSAAKAPRTQTLTTANPAEAPPAYRSAVADYFESLARDPAPAAPVQP